MRWAGHVAHERYEKCIQTLGIGVDGRVILELILEK